MEINANQGQADTQSILDIGRIIKDQASNLDFKGKKFDYDAFKSEVNTSNLSNGLKEFLYASLELKKAIIDVGGDFTKLDFSKVALFLYYKFKNKICCDKPEWIKGLNDFIIPIVTDTPGDSYTLEYFKRDKEINIFYQKIIPLRILASIFEYSHEHNKPLCSFEEYRGFFLLLEQCIREKEIKGIIEILRTSMFFGVHENPKVLDFFMDLAPYLSNNEIEEYELLRIISEFSGSTSLQKAYIDYVISMSDKEERSKQRLKFLETYKFSKEQIDLIDDVLAKKRNAITERIMTNKLFQNPHVLYLAYLKCLRKTREAKGKVESDTLDLLAAIYLHSQSVANLPDMKVPADTISQEQILQLICGNGVEEYFYRSALNLLELDGAAKILADERENIVKALIEKDSDIMQDDKVHPYFLRAAFEKLKRKKANENLKGMSRESLSDDYKKDAKLAAAIFLNSLCRNDFPNQQIPEGIVTQEEILIFVSRPRHCFASDFIKAIGQLVSSNNDYQTALYGLATFIESLTAKGFTTPFKEPDFLIAALDAVMEICKNNNKKLDDDTEKTNRNAAIYLAGTIIAVATHVSSKQSANVERFEEFANKRVELTEMLLKKGQIGQLEVQDLNKIVQKKGKSLCGIQQPQQGSGMQH